MKVFLFTLMLNCREPAKDENAISLYSNALLYVVRRVCAIILLFTLIPSLLK
ncbi:MAG: hypothetical protein PV340_03590 [Wolbachia sp.]|nr:hypothetical protein [Wolbachia sp.]MDD9335970.1 hypothetical protein [Wolbachia sp.]